MMKQHRTRDGDSTKSYVPALSLGLTLGTGAGAALGAALNNLPLGLAIGAGIGVGLGAAFQTNRYETTGACGSRQREHESS